MVLKAKPAKSNLRTKTSVQLIESLKPERVADPTRTIRRSKGKTVDMGICQFWAIIFDANEKLSKSKKLTDEAIKKLILKEFPDRPPARDLSEGKRTVNAFRILYNKGRFTRGVIPQPQSQRYNDKGEVITVKRKKRK